MSNFDFLQGEWPEVYDAARRAEAAAAQPDTHDYGEAETRDYFIDVLLAEAGWRPETGLERGRAGPAMSPASLRAYHLPPTPCRDREAGPGVQLPVER